MRTRQSDSNAAVVILIILCLCTTVSCKGGAKGGKGAAATSQSQDSVSSVDNGGPKVSHLAENWMIYGPVLGCIFLITLCVLYDKINNYRRYRASQLPTLDYTRVIEASCHTLDQVKVVHDPVTGLYVPIGCSVHDIEPKMLVGAPPSDYIEINSVQIGALEHRPTQGQVEQEIPLIQQEHVGPERHSMILEKQRADSRQQRHVLEQRSATLNESSPSTQSTLQGTSVRQHSHKSEEESSPGQVRKRAEKSDTTEKQRMKLVEFDGFQKTYTRSDGKSTRRPTFTV